MESSSVRPRQARYQAALRPDWLSSYSTALRAFVLPSGPLDVQHFCKGWARRLSARCDLAVALDPKRCHGGAICLTGWYIRQRVLPTVAAAHGHKRCFCNKLRAHPTHQSRPSWRQACHPSAATFDTLRAQSRPDTGTGSVKLDMGWSEYPGRALPCPAAP